MTFLPLYKQAREDRFVLTAENGVWKGHAGLWYDKFFDRWNENNFQIGKMEDGAKKGWIETVTGQKSGHEERIKEAITRQDSMVASLKGQVLPLKLTSPMVTGLGYSHPIENGFLWHHTLASPYLPGSSLKGLIRAWAESWCGEEAEDIRKAFGSSATGAGELIFFDALPTAPVQLVCEVMNPHIGKWRSDDKASRSNAPSDWNPPVPIFYLAIEAGTTFQFALSSRAGKLSKDDPAIIWLQDALNYLGAGAKTAVGFGRFLDEEKMKEYGQELVECIREQRRIEQEAEAAEAVAPPAEGEVANMSGQYVYIHSIEGDRAWVIYMDFRDEDVTDCEPDEDVLLSDLTRIN